MDLDRLTQRVDELALELTVQRLVTRSLIFYLFHKHERGGLAGIVAEMEKASDRTSTDVLPLPGVDPTLQTKASLLARERGRELLYSLGKVMITDQSRENKPVRIRG